MSEPIEVTYRLPLYAILAFAIAFCGEPDLHDALVARVSPEQCPNPLEEEQ
jgi:hypothetical protein